MNESSKRVADAAQDLFGPSAPLRHGDPGAPLDGRLERSYRYTVVDTIGGGASEIQKNIIARRGLGLPAS
jgi:3-oxocholest-4-en-26-oyl-CoA dehydrogenase alpha subunit